MLVGDIIVAKIYTYCIDQVGVNVYHYKCTAASAGNTYKGNDLAGTIGPLIAGPYKDLMAVPAEYVGTGTANFLPVPGVEFIDRTGAGAGISGNSVMAKQTAGIITKRTAAAGRAFRGRMYVAFPSETDNDTDGVPVASYADRLDGLAAVIFATRTLVGHVGETATLAPVVLSRAGGVPVATLMVDWLSRRKWANQRRRGSYGKPNARP